MFRSFQVTLMEPIGGNAVWTVRCGKLPKGTLGICDYNRKVIAVAAEGDEADVLAVLAHEVLHQSAPDLAEEAVLRMEHNYLAVLRGTLEQWEVV